MVWVRVVPIVCRQSNILGIFAIGKSFLIEMNDFNEGGRSADSRYLCQNRRGIEGVRDF
jgi:hypothetical protein